MQKELINNTIEMFDNYEKWNAYLELIAKFGEIKNSFYATLKNALIKHFCQDDIVEGWTCRVWDALNTRWFITQHGHDSLCLFLSSVNFHLWCNPSVYDGNKINELLIQPKYKPLIAGFTRIDRQLFYADWKITEDGNFYFNSPFDGNFNPETLAWFAGKKTNELVNQIAEKVDRYRKSEILTNLLVEINDLTKLAK